MVSFGLSHLPLIGSLLCSGCTHHVKVVVCVRAYMDMELTHNDQITFACM